MSACFSYRMDIILRLCAQTACTPNCYVMICTWISILKRRSSEVFARVHQLLGDGARVDGVQEVSRVGEVGGGGSDGVVVGGGACGQALHCLVGQRVQHLINICMIKEDKTSV